MDIVSSNSPQDNHKGGRPPKSGKYATPYWQQRSRRVYERHKADHSRWNKIARRKVKTKVFAHYSGSEIPFCACCGENNLEFLTIDHINGDGAAHRKTLPSNGRNTLYRWLIDNGYPEGFRVLCYNCNCARGFYGYCPHEKVHEKQMLLFKL